MVRTLPLLGILAAAAMVGPASAQALPPNAACRAVVGKDCSRHGLPTSPAPAPAVSLQQTQAPTWRSPAGATVVPHPCETAPGALCGSVRVPLERGDPTLGTIDIAFELHPHTDGAVPAKGTLVPNPGGPGVATITQRDLWRSMFAQVLDRYDLLLIDDRGRGASGLIDCPDAQHGIGELFAGIAACGAQLGAAAGSYGTAAIADDVDAVRAALGIAKITYYGASYGGVDMEAYATRHGEHLAALVADAPWTSLADPLQRFVVPALVREVALSCGRALGCGAQNPEPARALAWLSERLQRSPLTGTGIDFSGAPYHVVLDEGSMIFLLAGSSAGGFGPPGELTAATAAWRRDDSAPLLRLAAEQLSTNPFPPDSGDPRGFSMGSYLATWCTDSLELYDTTAPPKTRASQYAAALNAVPRSAFAPFSVPGYAEFLRFFEGGDTCVPWPTPRRDVLPPQARYPAVPTLMLAGDMDSIVPMEYVDGYAARWPDSSLVHVAGSGHVPTDFSPCANDVVLHFLATYETGDTACANVPIPAFATADFPLRVANARPAAVDAAAGGDRSRPVDRRAATVAALTVLDALKRGAMSGGPVNDAGLRGGRFSVALGPDGGKVAALDGDRYALDESVRGTASWDVGGQLDASVTVAGTDPGELHLAGPLLVTTADVLHVTGRLGGRKVALTVPAT